MPTEPDRQYRLFNCDKPTPRAPMAQPACHDRDSVTSFRAAQQIHQSGAHHRHLWRVYFGVVEHPGLTGPELAQRLGFEDRFQCLRRLSDLKNMGLACVGGRRKCTIRGRDCSTWYAAKAWPSRSRKPTAPEPCESKPRAATGATNPPTGTTTPERARSATAADLGRIPDGVTTADERRAMRERLAVDGSEHVKRFLGSLKP